MARLPRGPSTVPGLRRWGVTGAAARRRGTARLDAALLVAPFFVLRSATEHSDPWHLAGRSQRVADLELQGPPVAQKPVEHVRPPQVAMEPVLPREPDGSIG